MFYGNQNLFKNSFMFLGQKRNNPNYPSWEKGEFGGIPLNASRPQTNYLIKNMILKFSLCYVKLSKG